MVKPVNLRKQGALWALCWCWIDLASATLYLSAEKFVQGAFAEPPPVQVVWLRGALRDEIESILGHRYPSLRIRCWSAVGTGPGQSGALRSAWILEEIGKQLPITVGLVINDNKIESVQVLEFRESRGAEVRYPAFTRQFQGLTLTETGRLSATVDGISGATLSVSALKRLSRVALSLHQHISAND